MATSPARRLWLPPDCPAPLTARNPYGPGACALVFGGTVDDVPPTDWLAALPAALGLTPAAAGTLVLRRPDAFLWTAYWDPTGEAVPAEPWTPEPNE
jgi:hypothetical protein